MAPKNVHFENPEALLRLLRRTARRRDQPQMRQSNGCCKSARASVRPAFKSERAHRGAAHLGVAEPRCRRCEARVEGAVPSRFPRSDAQGLVDCPQRLWRLPRPGLWGPERPVLRVWRANMGGHSEAQLRLFLATTARLPSVPFSKVQLRLFGSPKCNASSNGLFKGASRRDAQVQRFQTRAHLRTGDSAKMPPWRTAVVARLPAAKGATAAPTAATARHQTCVPARRGGRDSTARRQSAKSSPRRSNAPSSTRTTQTRPGDEARPRRRGNSRPRNRRNRANRRRRRRLRGPETPGDGLLPAKSRREARFGPATESPF
ncbi:hypothetical protein M885DRAFT_287528 [Pelagophyceae sp. CCMP2097]|nr:hypothetical protein M885DRAFT_287528 [Pelagophyceae sp. CCMP2097]